MINQFREQYSFKGVPLVFELRGKHQQEHEHPTEVSGFQRRPKVEVDVNLDVEGKDFDELPDLQEEVDSSYFN